jgi:hypothetical protein
MGITNDEIEKRRREYFRYKWGEFAVLICIIASLVAVLIPVVKRVKDAARRADEQRMSQRK